LSDTPVSGKWRLHPSRSSLPRCGAHWRSIWIRGRTWPSRAATATRKVQRRASLPTPPYKLGVVELRLRLDSLLFARGLRKASYQRAVLPASEILVTQFAPRPRWAPMGHGPVRKVLSCRSEALCHPGAVAYSPGSVRQQLRPRRAQRERSRCTKGSGRNEPEAGDLGHLLSGVIFSRASCRICRLGGYFNIKVKRDIRRSDR